MPKPIHFQTDDEVVSKLQSDAVRKSAHEYFSNRIVNLDDVVKSSVTSNTFRSFRGMTERPSVIFRDWAIYYIKTNLDDIITAADIDHYNAAIHAGTISLLAEFDKYSSHSVGYGRSAKLLNLLIKRLMCFDIIPKTAREKTIELLHVPLDSFTIQGLWLIAPQLNISKNSTMNFIQSKMQYDNFQQVINVICKKAGVPPIYYELLTWNLSHPK